MSYLRSDFDPNNPSPLPRPLHQIALLLVDYLVATGVLKDAEALRREGAARERKRSSKPSQKREVQKRASQTSRKTVSKKKKGAPKRAKRT